MLAECRLAEAGWLCRRAHLCKGSEGVMGERGGGKFKFRLAVTRLGQPRRRRDASCSLRPSTIRPATVRWTTRPVKALSCVQRERSERSETAGAWSERVTHSAARKRQWLPPPRAGPVLMAARCPRRRCHACMYYDASLHRSRPN